MPGKDSAAPTSSRKETAAKREVKASAKPEALPPHVSPSMPALQQALVDPQKMRPADVLALQRLYGNQAVTQLLANHPLQAKSSIETPAIQRVEEEEEIQARPLVQRAAEEEELQARFIQRKAAPQLNGDEAQPRPNQTGLPDELKSGIESLSGIALDDVRVHYGSDRPAQVDALAYTQGSEIHVAPGQEQHLPHEAWHVVQQAQGRVRPTMQLEDGVQVNDDRGLEHEADVMGTKAFQMRRSDQPVTGLVNPMQLVSAVAQLQTKPQFVDEKLKNYANALFKARPAQGVAVGDGSALAACSHEVNGGDRVGGADHIKKCDDILNGIEKLIDKHDNPRSPYTLSKEDYDKAVKLESDLHDALEGKYAG